MLEKVMKRVVGSSEVGAIEPRELADLIKQQRVVVVDNNHEARWASGHVPGAINLPRITWRKTFGRTSSTRRWFSTAKVLVAEHPTTRRSGRSRWGSQTSA